MKKLLSFLLVALMALTLCGCSSSSDNTTGDAPVVPTDKTVKIELVTAPVGLHPLKTNDSASTFVNGQIFETLYYRTVDGTDYKPLLAESLPEFSEDGLTATIHLRQNVKFHNGNDFTADAVAYMIDCLKDKDYGSQRPSIVESIESYEIVDDHTIALHLAYVDGVLVAKLAHTNGCIVDPATDKAQDLMIDPTGAGTGPYKFVSAEAGANYVLTANEDYWQGSPSVKDVRFDVVASESTAVARLQTGEADLYPTVAADSFATVSGISGVTAVSDPSSSVYYLSLRSDTTAKNDLMANPDFRKALIEAIDIKTFVEAYFNTSASFVKSILGPTLVGYTADMDKACVEYNQDDAKAIIDANGWAGQEVTFLVSTREAHQTTAAYVQEQLAKVGITVNVVSEEWATFLADAKTDDYYDFCILSWSNVTGDGQQMLEPNFSTKNGTRTKYNNAEFDEYVTASARTTVLAERQAAMLKAVNKIQGDCIVTPLYSMNTQYAYSNKISNVQFDKGGQFNIFDFKLAD